jgi:hypothetical protein
MEFIKKIKNNRGVTITDVVIGLMILIIFTVILTSSFYKIYSYNLSIRMNAIAVDYCIKILEDIDQMKYEDVNNDLNSNIKEKYEISDLYNVTLEIENYNKDDSEKEDIIKIVKVNIVYKLNGEEKTYSIKKLKIKEL